MACLGTSYKSAFRRTVQLRLWLRANTEPPAPRVFCGLFLVIHPKRVHDFPALRRSHQLQVFDIHRTIHRRRRDDGLGIDCSQLLR